MPRSKPSDCRELRLSLSTWERDRIEGLGIAVGLGTIAAGVGVLALPFALVAAPVLAALLIADNLDEALDKVKDLGDRITHPNRLGGEGAVKTLGDELTAGVDGGDSPFTIYQQTSAWRKGERMNAFDAIHGPGATDDPRLSTEWAAWVNSNPLPLLLGLKTGGIPGAIPDPAGVVYQTSIRVTAARRTALSIAGIVNPPALLATLFGSAMPGDYFTKASGAPGYIADPLLDWAATTAFSGEPWGGAIRAQSETGARLVALATT